jgi:hypothetical protein
MNNSGKSKQSMESVLARDEIIDLRVKMLAAVFGRKITDDLIIVFKRVLGVFSTRVLGKAFSKAEAELERFPTPKQMAAIAGELMPSGLWRYNFEPGEAPDPDTGMLVNVLIDPDPSCDVCREPRSRHPHDKCTGMVDELYAHAMYRPQDCPEGRAFLAVLRKIGESKKPKTVDLKLSAANLQAQKLAILKIEKD